MTGHVEDLELDSATPPPLAAVRECTSNGSPATGTRQPTLGMGST